MTKDELKQKLWDMGIQTDNCYPKSSFPHDAIISVGLYDRELKEDFYFFNKYDSKIYKLMSPVNYKEAFDYDPISEKYMVPLSCCSIIWEDKPFVELPDARYNEMTLRQYACIHLKIPESGLDWLDKLIEKTG